jgi:hypothetical protein
MMAPQPNHIPSSAQQPDVRIYEREAKNPAVRCFEAEFDAKSRTLYLRSDVVKALGTRATMHPEATIGTLEAWDGVTFAQKIGWEVPEVQRETSQLRSLLESYEVIQRKDPNLPEVQFGVPVPTDWEPRKR